MTILKYFSVNQKNIYCFKYLNIYCFKTCFINALKNQFLDRPDYMQAQIQIDVCLKPPDFCEHDVFSSSPLNIATGTSHLLILPADRRPRPQSPVSPVLHAKFNLLFLMCFNTTYYTPL
jgi:hypothetical protein